MSLVVTSWPCNCDERILPCPVTTLPTPNTSSDSDVPWQSFLVEPVIFALEGGNAVRRAGWGVRVSRDRVAHFALKININRTVIIGELFRGGGTCPRRGGKRLWKRRWLRPLANRLGDSHFPTFPFPAGATAARLPLSLRRKQISTPHAASAHTRQLRKGVTTYLSNFTG